MSARATAARPKRAGESFARTHHAQEEGPSSKKPRFDIRNPSALAPDAPEEDAILELDEIGKGGQQTKRGAVNLDGYGSDSSNEGFDARVERKAEAARRQGKKSDRSEPEDETDMFADLAEETIDPEDDEDPTREGKKAKKDPGFLEENEIEGQEQDSKGGGHVSVDFTSNGVSSSKGKWKGKARAYDSSSESDDDGSAAAAAAGEEEEVDEEVGAGGKKTRAPKLSAFNMKEELEEGRFDKEGNFVRKAGDPDAVHDTWLEGISKKDRRRAREAEEKRAEEQRQRTLADDQVLTSDALGTLISRLDRGETVLEALARLGKGMEKKRPKWQAKRKAQKQSRKEGDENGDNNTTNGDSGSMDLDNDATQAQDKQRAELDAITGAADLLLTRGQANIYDDSREALTRQYRRETGDEWVDETKPRTPDTTNPTITHNHGPSSSGNAQWEYRWADGRDGGEVHGPYDGPTMAAWQTAGFFQEGVEFRQTHPQRADEDGDEGDEEWGPVVDFF